MLMLRRSMEKKKKHSEVIITLSGRCLFKCATITRLMDMSTELADVKDFGMPHVQN